MKKLLILLFSIVLFFSTKGLAASAPLIPTFTDETMSPRVGCELLEFQSLSSIRVWINLDMTLEEFEAIPLPSIDEIQFPYGWFKNQPRVSDGGPDSGRFLRSPGAAVDGEFLVEEHFGHSWTYNAKIIQTNIPLDNQGLLTGNIVAKFHEVTFNAGRTITVLFSPEDVPYVLIGRDLNRTSDEPSIPDLWRLVEFTTPDQLVIMLPEETLNIRTDNEDSFQGPISVAFVPIPATAYLFGAALFGLAFIRRGK